MKSVMTDELESRQEPEHARREERRPLAVVSSSELLRGQREVLIQHGGDVYRLICTKRGKLLLNKE